MNEKQKFFDDFNQGLHRIGKIMMVLTIILLTGVPILIAVMYDASVDGKGFFAGMLSIGFLYIAISVVEFLIYTPMLGVGGSYLSFITGNVTNMTNMFSTCTALTSLDLSNFNTSNVTTMVHMFDDCTALTSIDLSSFNTSRVTNMADMFSTCTALTSLDLSNFDTSSVTDMGYMFSYCTALTNIDLSSFDTSRVTNVNGMFYNCSNTNLIIYVKDETVKTKIESSSNFPTTATVVIGSPN